MANVLAELFANTASAIREKTGDSGTMKPAEFPEKIRGIETGSTSKLVPLIVTENGTYTPSGAFDPSGGTYSFKASYTQEYLSALYAEASVSGTFPLNETTTGASLINNGDTTALYALCFAFGANNYYGLMKECDEPKFWVSIEVATALGQSAEGWYTPTGTSFTPSDIPEYPVVENATYTVGLDDIALLFEYDDFDGYSSVTVNVVGSATDAIVWTVTFIGADGSFFYEKPCISGDDCYDPVITGKIETPTKESTVQYTYSYRGWSLTSGGSADDSALSAVTEDRTVYAAFAENIRYYTVRFYDGETIMKTESVAYGSQATPPSTEKGDGYMFDGWTPSDLTITGDTDFYGSWKQSEKLEAYTWEEIAAISESGEAKNKFFVGDTKTFTFTNLGGGTYTSTAILIGFNHDDLADGSGKAGMTFMCMNGSHLGGRVKYNEQTTTAHQTLSWGGTSGGYRITLYGNSGPGMWGTGMKNLFKEKITTYYDLATDTYKTITDKAFPISLTELGFDISNRVEGSCYEYFASGKAVGTAYNELVMQSPWDPDNGVATQYWTRTRSTQKYAYTIDTSGKAVSTVQTNACYAGLCFCL